MPSVNQNDLENNIIVSYPTRETTQVITVAEYELIRNLDQNKVVAIKFIRSQYKLGLYEAKQVVDTVHSHPRFTRITD